jgi:glycosyltransferase involved in cell wall biosynthesis
MKTNKLISIITPSYNCADYIRDCIESVLSQEYENFEHIIVDGASQDGTVDILKQYPHLKWISEPDNGEAEALNKALRMVTGDIIGWLNADDLYFGKSFHSIAEEINPQQGRHVGVGKVLIINERDEIIGVRIPKVPITLPSLMRWFGHTHLYQPSMFYSKELVRDVGFYREELYFSIDYDYWLRIATKGYQYHYINQVLSKARLIRTGAKSANPRVEQEKNWQEVCTSYEDFLAPSERVDFWRDYYEYRLQRYQEYPQAQPPNKYALIGLSLLLIDRGHLPDMRFLINHLVSEPDCADVYWLLGEALYRGGYPNQAKKVFEQAVALESNDTSVSPALTAI